MATAATINQYLAAKRSPLAGHGAVFIREAAAVGIDPRFLVAITGAETSFGTSGNAAGIHNPFGLGPGIRYPTWDAAIRAAAQNLGGPKYKGAGLFTIAQIQGTWAPGGATNDPTNLNSFWRTNVTKFFTEQGGSGVQGASVFPGKNAGFGGFAAGQGPQFTNPVRGATFTVGGRPGQGSHDGRPPFDNWQSRDAYDLNVPVGTPVYAPAGGVITKISQGPSSGRTQGIAVTIKADGTNAKLSFFMGHLSRLAPGVKVGPIAGGQLIGYSGRGNGVAHLHFAAQSTDGKFDIWATLLGSTSTDLGHGKFKGGESKFSVPGPGSVSGTPGIGLPDALNPVKWVEALTGWVAGNAAKALAYVVIGAIGVYLLAQGSSHAFGTPSPRDVAGGLTKIAA